MSKGLSNIIVANLANSRLNDMFGLRAAFGVGKPSNVSPSGLVPVLVIDPTQDLYQIDTDGSLQRYMSPNKTLPSIVIDPTRGEYGGPL